MKPYFIKTPKILTWWFTNRIWFFSNSNNKVYLTFDDGPISKVTPWVLKQLKAHKAKATFFCIGDNIRKHPDVFNEILNEGHTIGNHTYHHINGWKTNTKKYLLDCNKFEEIFNSSLSEKSKFLNKYSKKTNLFRPPYGKLTSAQAKQLQKNGYKIVMWDVLSADFDKSITKEKCLENVINNIQPGSIIVFHDSLKAEEKLRYVLPKVLNYINKQNWKCARI